MSNRTKRDSEKPPDHRLDGLGVFVVGQHNLEKIVIWVKFYITDYSSERR